MLANIWYVRASVSGRRSSHARATSASAAPFCLGMFVLLASCLTHGAAARDAHKDEVDTEHLFGFTIGSDIGEKGEKEFESETLSRTGKNGGSYAAFFEQLEAKYTLAQSFRIAAAAVLARHDISNVPDLEDRRSTAFQGLSLDARFRLLDRERSPVGLTVSVEPHWSRIDGISGERVQNYGGTVTLALDKELVARRIYAAVNVLYEPETTHFLETDIWERQSTIGVSGALVARVRSGVFLGGEIVYRRLYDGLGFDGFLGRALFAGPTFYAKLSEHWWASMAWNIQVTGRAADQPGALDLVNFERHKILLRFGCNW